jgi:hypothetical protein
LADAYLETNYWIYDSVLEWPYVYVAGSALSGGIYRCCVAKIRVDSFPFVQEDYAEHETYAGSQTSFQSIAIDSNFVYVSGYYQTISNSTAVVKKLDKTNLSTVLWTYTKIHPVWFGHTMTFNIFTGCGTDGVNVYACAVCSYSGGGDFGMVSKLDLTTGAEIWNVNANTDSWLQGIRLPKLGFYTTNVDVYGNFSGVKVVARFTKAAGVRTFYPAPAVGYSWEAGIPDGGGNYYLVGSTTPAYNQYVIKVGQANPDEALKIWGYTKNLKPGGTLERFFQVCTDGPYVYACAELFDASFTPPITGGFVKLDSATGLEVWYVLHGTMNIIPYAIQEHGPYIYIGEAYYNAPPGGPYGRVERRNKSNGAISESGPTMDQIMRGCKWFSGGSFQGMYLGWR